MASKSIRRAKGAAAAANLWTFVPGLRSVIESRIQHDQDVANVRALLNLPQTAVEDMLDAFPGTASSLIGLLAQGWISSGWWNDLYVYRRWSQLAQRRIRGLGDIRWTSPERS